MWLQWLAGLLSFLVPFCRQSVRAFILPIHTFFGVVIFCFAVATAMMGITEKLIWALYVVVSCLLILTLILFITTILLQPFNGRSSGTTRVGRYQKKHLPAHTHPGQRTSFITFLH